MIKKLIFLFICSITTLTSFGQEKPNVVFIGIDDINDWIEPLGGHKQAITPNMDSFCKNGAMIFKNAVCAAPICGPSRSAILSGFLPSTSGVYGNGHNMIYSDIVKENATLPEYFSKNGYHTMSNGKIFHKHATEHGVDFGEWAFDEFARARRYNADPVNRKFLTSGNAGIINGVKKPEYKINERCKLSWGPTTDSFEEMVDYKVAEWATHQLEKEYKKPFFMCVGFIKPHLPWFVPQEFFDMYDLDKIETPIVKEDDLDDILTPSGKKAFKPLGEYKWIKKHGLEKEATRAYLANISYADKCFGMVIDALNKSKYADNTIVVIWGDHGWHLGEKLRYLKNTLWSEAVKPPLMIRTPDMKKTVYNEKPVSLLDLYPTLNELCGLPQKKNLDGHDFSKLLKNPKSRWEYPGVTVSSNGTSVLTEEWHYIKNLSGAEELYNVKKDSMEWENLINNKKYSGIVKNLRKWVPKKRIKGKRIHFSKPPHYVDADQDPTINERRKLEDLK